MGTGHLEKGAGGKTNKLGFWLATGGLEEQNVNEQDIRFKIAGVYKQQSIWWTQNLRGKGETWEEAGKRKICNSPLIVPLIYSTPQFPFSYHLVQLGQFIHHGQNNVC